MVDDLFYEDPRSPQHVRVLPQPPRDKIVKIVGSGTYPLDVMMARRKVSLTELALRAG